MLGMSQRRRLLTAAVFGVLAAVVTALGSPWQLAVLVGWVGGALVIVGSIWAFVPRLDAVQTEAAAGREDLDRTTDDLVVLVASVVSLIGVVLALIDADRQAGALKAVMIGASVATVVISWLTVQTIFTLRYARLYYAGPNEGIDFPGGKPPDYLDFAYLAFTIGMTFQVSDTSLSSRAIRRTATRHALLSYLFGTVIIGVTINVVGGLIH